MWEVEPTVEFDQWFAGLSLAQQKRIVAAIEALRQAGPGLGRPLVDAVKGSRHSNMKELRRGTLRVLFAFDPTRTAVLLVGGDKKGRWREWYTEAIALADRLYERHLRESARRKE
ncbi:MAG: type II toxin-antitoxin system RelE/ParE family toxin [Solirubrobacterales bacterium]